MDLLFVSVDTQRCQSNYGKIYALRLSQSIIYEKLKGQMSLLKPTL